MEKTLSIIKPDGVARGLIGEVIKRLESNGLKVICHENVENDQSSGRKFLCSAQRKAIFSKSDVFHDIRTLLWLWFLRGKMP